MIRCVLHACICMKSNAMQLYLSYNFGESYNKHLKAKFKSFGCDTIEIDGHSIKKIYESLKVENKKNMPKAIIANTIKGKGFKLFENNNNWHHSVITKSIYKEILKEL